MSENLKKRKDKMDKNFSVRNIVVIYLLWNILISTGFSQTKSLFSSEEMTRANTAKDANFLSAEEKEVIRYMNLARMDGKRFFDSFIQSFVDSFNSVYSSKIKPNNSYLKSLKKDIYKIKNLPLIYPDKSLTKAAISHAKDMGKTGKVGHKSSDGRSMEKRVEKYFEIKYSISENCDYGFNKGKDIVCHLLIDNGVPSVGHRKNILNAEQDKAGVSIQPHKVFLFNCVIDYSGVKRN